jgi:hypothetical protein
MEPWGRAASRCALSLSKRAGVCPSTGSGHIRMRADHMEMPLSLSKRAAYDAE